MIKRIVSLLIAFVIVFGFSQTALAQEVPDLNKAGTITFTMDWDGKPLDSGSLSLYQVGNIVNNDGSYSFELIDKLKYSKLSLEKVDDPDLAKELAGLAKKENLTEISADITDGKAFFASVAPGLYVVVQDENDASEGFAAISSFLISVPRYENGDYDLNITSNPKVPLATEPTETTQPGTTKPSDPKLPQTGQLNWPVPLLAVSGLVLLAVGWLLCFGSRKEDYEK